MGRVTLGCFVICKLQVKCDIVYLRLKFDDYSFSCSRDIVGGFKVGHVALTTPPLRVICHPSAGKGRKGKN